MNLWTFHTITKLQPRTKHCRNKSTIDTVVNQASVVSTFDKMKLTSGKNADITITWQNEDT